MDVMDIKGKKDNNYILKLENPKHCTVHAHFQNSFPKGKVQWPTFDSGRHGLFFCFRGANWKL